MSEQNVIDAAREAINEEQEKINDNFRQALHESVTLVSKTIGNARIPHETKISLIGEVGINLLAGFFSSVSRKTGMKFNETCLNPIVQKYTGQSIVIDRELVNDLATREKLVQSQAFENMARKYNYIPFVKENGYLGMVQITKAIRTEYEDLVGEKAAVIGQFGINPDTMKIQEDKVCGLHVLSCNGKILIESEVEYKELMPKEQK